MDNELEKAKLLLEAWKVTVETQRHFNDMAMRIRNFGFVLVAASMGAAGFSFRSDYHFNLFDNQIPVSSLILMFGATIWWFIKFLDHKWYSSFLKGSVTTATKQEKILNEVISPDKEFFTLTKDISEASQKVSAFWIDAPSKMRSSIFHNGMIGLQLALSVIFFCLAK